VSRRDVSGDQPVKVHATVYLATTVVLFASVSTQERGRKLWGLPLVAHTQKLHCREASALVGLGLAVPSPGVPLAPPLIPTRVRFI
jgi:hypothetical protein